MRKDTEFRIFMKLHFEAKAKTVRPKCLEAEAKILASRLVCIDNIVLSHNSVTF